MYKLIKKDDVVLFEPKVKKKKPRRKRPKCKDPKNPDDIPRKVPYLLIGGGTAAFSAFRAIKSADPKAHVLVVSEEYEFPYMRPPLSKEMWFDNSPENIEKLMFKQWNGSIRRLAIQFLI